MLLHVEVIFRAMLRSRYRATIWHDALLFNRSTTVPIDDIEAGIRASDICLADITTDNPNIWYEVGFAFANEKPVVLICAKVRPTNPPFDVRHRQIIFYSLDAPSDFTRLQKEISARLKA